MIEHKTFSEIQSKAEHYKALGQTEIYLDGKCPDFPWHLVTRCEPGGSHRLEIHTDVWFYAHDPESGLDFRWSFDIEPRSANGVGTYQIDSAGCREVFAKLPPAALVSFRKYLSDCSVAVAKRAREYHDAASKQFADARTLEELGKAL